MEVTFWDKVWLVSIGVVACLVTIILITNSHRLQRHGDLIPAEASAYEAQAPRIATDSAQITPPQKAAAAEQTEQSGRSSSPHNKVKTLPQVKEEEVATPVLQAVKSLKGADPPRTSRFANQMVGAT
ncbi:hypothetical protein Vretimale_79 [Volvox reticuliferus]|uniref:Uncharacterized protein n=1 Tax=Volvox reticuliferus TaxID=1737510 RepID=A0A8J4CAI0_9CHLO|nr:hypothetical protein Vretifemale_8420 [Volvox reticuliferus]GIL93776.1 hypothetical protein Vretimale_79 [Volvox reticuliferus]